MGCYVPNTHHEGKKIAGKLTTAMRKGGKKPWKRSAELFRFGKLSLMARRETWGEAYN